MATPIPFDVPPRNPGVAATSRLADAPAEHAEALLAAYHVLQGLHEAGVLDVLRAALESRDEVVGIAVRALGGPGALRTARNVFLLIEMLGNIDPGVLRALTRAVPEAMSGMVGQPDKSSLWAMLKDVLWDEDFRHAAAAVDTMAKTFGRSLLMEGTRAPAR